MLTTIIVIEGKITNFRQVPPLPKHPLDTYSTRTPKRQWRLWGLTPRAQHNVPLTVRFPLGDSMSGASQIVRFLFCLNSSACSKQQSTVPTVP